MMFVPNMDGWFMDRLFMHVVVRVCGGATMLIGITGVVFLFLDYVDWVKRRKAGVREGHRRGRRDLEAHRDSGKGV